MAKQHLEVYQQPTVIQKSDGLEPSAWHKIEMGSYHKSKYFYIFYTQGECLIIVKCVRLGAGSLNHNCNHF